MDNIKYIKHGHVYRLICRYCAAVRAIDAWYGLAGEPVSKTPTPGPPESTITPLSVQNHLTIILANPQI